MLSHCYDVDCSTIQVLEFHGRLQLDNQRKVFDPAPRGMRKIVFATNSAETSVTIPGIRYAYKYKYQTSL